MKHPAWSMVVVLLGLAAGPTPMDRLPRDKAGEIVRRGIEFAGGWNTWAGKKTVQFRQITRRFRRDGTVERQREQLHRYRLQPGFAVRIDWEENGKKFALINNGRFSTKVVNGVEDLSTDAGREARNVTFESEYVFAMPFKLTDAGAHLESIGPAKLSDGTVADRVRVTYDKGVGDAGGLHTWTFSFDSKSGRLCASHFKREPAKFDFSEHLEEKTFDGIRLATKRLGYGADAAGKKGPRISETIYEDVRFDVPLEDRLFQIPPQ